MIKQLWDKILRKILTHKIISIVLAIIVLAGGFYLYSKFFSSTTTTQYVLATVEKGTLVASVSGSGQVSVSDQVDIKPKVSGDVVYVGVKEGQEVAAGTLLVQLNAQDAQKTVRDAQINLDSAKLSLQKLQQSSADPNKIHEDSFNSISNAFLDLPTIMSGAEIIINGSTLNNTQSNQGFYKDFVYNSDKDQAALFVLAASNDFAAARSQYDNTLTLYKNTNRYADSTTTLNLLDKTTETVKAIAQALKSEQSLLDYLVDYISKHSEKSLPTLVNTYRNNLQTYIGQINSHLSDLISIQSTVKNTPLDVLSQEISVEQRENALLDAQEKLADYYIRAPFSGVVADVAVKNGDSASSGTAVATIITKKKIAEISFNEVDIAKMKIGQKATLTFDAVSDLTITGEVIQVDAIGTVSQGVVTYGVKIAFDAQDDRVKSGMSTSAAVITDTKQDVLLVPNAAVKARGSVSYVQMPDSAENLTLDNSGGNQGVVLKFTALEQPVGVGLSNDSTTEITSGLKEGDLVIVRTVSSTATTQTQSNSSFRIPGLGGGR